MIHFYPLDAAKWHIVNPALHAIFFLRSTCAHDWGFTGSYIRNCIFPPRLSENKCKQPGDYLVRYSARATKYVLTCNNSGTPKHFMIQTINAVSLANMI